MANSDFEPFSYVDQFDNFERGITTDITKIIAQKGNFTFDVFYYEGKLNRSGIIPHFEFRIEVTSLMFVSPTHVTSTFKSAHLIFVLTPPSKLTNWEKVLLPFDESTWKFLLITFGVAFVTVFIVNQMPEVIKKGIYGEKVRNPAYNILGNFFGIGQLQLPYSNFARILLMFFTIFCLIIRTAYQGVIFGMMTSVMTHKSPETIEDLFTQNYTIVSLDEEWAKTFLTELIPESRRPNIIYFDRQSYNIMFFKFNDVHSAKFAFLTDDNLVYQGSNLKEVFLSDSIGIRMARNSVFYWITEDTLQFLTSAGISQQIFNFYMEISYRLKIKIDQGPSVLTIDDLQYGFVIWIVASGLTILAFVGEVFVKFFIFKIKRGFGNFLVLSGLIKVLRNNKA